MKDSKRSSLFLAKLFRLFCSRSFRRFLLKFFCCSKIKSLDCCLTLLLWLWIWLAIRFGFNEDETGFCATFSVSLLPLGASLLPDAFCLRSATCAAITLCRSTTNKQLEQLQSRHRQYFLCPF